MSSMSATRPPRAISNEIRVIDFDAVRFKAPIPLRAAAVALDYLLIAIFPVLGLLAARLFGDDGAQLLNSDLNNFAWLIAVIVGVSNLVILPMANGQSIGKALVGIRIVSKSGGRASVPSILIRQLPGYFLSLATAGLGLLVAFVEPKGRALHDLLACTVVVRGKMTER